MREGWQPVALSDVFKTVTGNTPPKNNANYYGDFIPFVKPPELNGGFVNEADDNLSVLGVSVARVVPKNSVLVSCIGILGKVALSEREVAFNQQINAILPNEKMAIPKFVYYQTLSDGFRDQLEALSSGTTVSIVNKSRFNSIRFVVPPLPEQQRIVAILDEAFAGLAIATANAEKNLKSARELFDSYLNSTFGKASQGWIDKPLDAVAKEFGRGKSKHRPRNDPSLYGGKYPFIQTGDVRNADHLIVEYSQTYNEKGLAQSKLWPKGTICITIAANIAETGILGFDACFPDSVIGMVVDPLQTNNKFVEYLLRFFKAVLQAQGKGSAQDNINLATFEVQKFPFPAVSVQNALVERLDGMTGEIRRLEASYLARLESISELKRSILQKAFSGELTSPPTQAIKEAAE